MSFANGYLLVLILPVLLILYKKQKNNTLSFSSVKMIDKKQQKNQWPYYIGKALIAISLVLFVVALARPQLELPQQPIKEKGIDIALIFDVSGSMQSVDFEPSRLEVARNTINTFITERVNDRMALVVFAGSAYTKIPLTLDHEVLASTLEKVEVESVKEQGTAIGMAISVGVNRLKKSDAEAKVMILVTDGDNNAGTINPMTASELAKDYNIKIYTIGVGTDQTIMPVDYFGTVRYQTVEGGLNEPLLEDIAKLTQGKYYRAKDESSLKQVFEEINQLEKTDFESKAFKNYYELAFRFIGAGLILLLLGIYFDQYKYIHIP